ncbi:MAG: hypothetical protein ABIH83_02900 [Candidatus Micrarchaeota archaeon]
MPKKRKAKKKTRNIVYAKDKEVSAIVEKNLKKDKTLLEKLAKL